MADAARDENVDPVWRGGGRGVRWRVGMFAGGLLLAGYGVALVCWPRLLGWTVAGVFGLGGAFCIVSALLARGRGR